MQLQLNLNTIGVIHLKNSGVNKQIHTYTAYSSLKEMSHLMIQLQERETMMDRELDFYLEPVQQKHSCLLQNTQLIGLIQHTMYVCPSFFK